jgi:PAS domain S-box-containing protein
MRSKENPTGLRMSIRVKMLLFFGGGVTVILISVNLLSLFGIPFTRISGNYQNHRSEVIGKIDDVAQLKKEEIHRWFSERINHIRIFSETAGFDSLAKRYHNGLACGEDKRELLAGIRNLEEYEIALLRARSVLRGYAGDSEIWIVDIKTGLVILSTGEGNRGLDLSEHDGIKNARLPGVKEQVYFRKETPASKECLYILYPISPSAPRGDEDLPSLVAVFILSPENLLTPMLSAGTGRDRSGEMILVDMNRIILSPLKYPLPGNNTAKLLEYRLDTKSAELAAWGIDGHVFSKDYRGVPVIAAVRHIRITSEFGIGLIIKIDEEEIMAFARQSLTHSLLISGAGLLFLLCFVYFFSGKISRPIILLSRTAEKVMAGNLGERAFIKTRDEVGGLSDAFNSMVERIQQWQENLEIKVGERTALLSESEERFRKVFEEGPLGMAMGDVTDGRFIRANRIFCEMLGYTEEELKRLTFLDVTHPDHRALDLKAVTEMREGQLQKHNTEKRYLKKSGEVIWGARALTKIDSADGKLSYNLAMIEDITERKRADEERRLLNEELLAVNRIIMMTTTEVQGILERVLDEALAITGLEGGTICLVSPGDTLQLAAHRATSEVTIQELTTNSINIGDCLCGQCARDQRPLILPDREAVLKFATREVTRGEDIRFHAAFPLLVAKKCLGVLCVFTRTEKKPSERRLKLIETVSSQIALAVENAKLYEETLKHAVTLENKVKERTNALEENQKALMNVMEDLSEKREALKVANVRLLELDRLKNIFLASMSHELRTPLNSIIGFTGILLMGLTGKLNGEQMNQLGLVKKSAHHLLGLINDILDISKVEAGMMESFPEEFSLNELAREILAGVSVAAAEKGLELICSLPEGLILFTDQRRLRQILINLVSNAIKFTTQGSIHLVGKLSLIDRTPVIRISVTDTGIGIRKEDMNRLFFPFQQVDASLTKKFEGTGLGLYLSKKLANLLGGDVTAKSEYGKGCEFMVALPLRIDKKE